MKRRSHTPARSGRGGQSGRAAAQARATRRPTGSPSAAGRAAGARSLRFRSRWCTGLRFLSLLVAFEFSGSLPWRGERLESEQREDRRVRKNNYSRDRSGVVLLA